MAVRRRQGGVVAIEVAMGMLGFLAIIFYWMEVSYMGFVSSLVDYTVATASRESRITPSTDYHGNFKKIVEESGSVWTVFIKPEEFTLDIRYFRSVEKLAQAQDTTDSAKSPLAVYRVSYPYQPLFLSLLFGSGNNLVISREVVAIQEHERVSSSG